MFSSFTYTALGHLHGPQQAGSPVVRYSGSLMKYSFGEAGQDKGVVLVDMDGDGTVRTTFRPLEAKRDVRIIKGYFADIMAAEDGRTDDYVLLRLEDREPILDVMGRGRKNIPIWRRWKCRTVRSRKRTAEGTGISASIRMTNFFRPLPQPCARICPCPMKNAAWRRRYGTVFIKKREIRHEAGLFGNECIRAVCGKRSP